MAFCSRLFETKRGVFVDQVPIGVAAILPDGRMLSNDYGGKWMVGRPGGSTESSTEGSLSDSLAISPSGKRFVTVERGSLIVREIDPLKEVTEIELGEVSPDPTVGFLADERVIAIVPGDCKTTRGRNKGGSRWQKTDCASRSWMVVEDDKLVKLRDAADVESIAFSSGGNRAIVQRPDGTRAVIELPGGNEVVKLPGRAGDAEDDHGFEPMALDRSGERAAYLDDKGVVVVELAGATFTAIARVDEATPRDLVFAPDGKTLYLSTNERVVALREGAPERAIAMPKYEVKPPEGFSAFGVKCASGDEPEETGSDELCRARQHGLGGSGVLFAQGWTMSLPDGHVKAFYNREEFAEVYVTAVDPSEFPEQDAAAWAKSIVASESWAGAEVDPKTSIKMRGARAFEFAEFWRSGCEPSDVYTSVLERDGLLYRVRIKVPSETDQKLVAQLLKTFVDEPFGTGDVGARAFATPPPSPDGPC